MIPEESLPGPMKTMKLHPLKQSLRSRDRLLTMHLRPVK